MDVAGRCWKCDHAHCDGSCRVRPLDEKIQTIMRETHERLDHADGDPDRLYEEELEYYRHEDIPGPEIDFLSPVLNTADERPESPLARLVALNKHVHTASTHVLEASVSLSLEQRRVLDMPTMQPQTTQRRGGRGGRGGRGSWWFEPWNNTQQVLASIAPDIRERVESLMEYEYKLRQEWFEMHTVLVENAQFERRACQADMRIEMASLDKALSAEGIAKIVCESGLTDIRCTLALIATRRKRVKRQYIRSNWECSEPIAIIDALYSLREAQYKGMHITSDDWRLYEQYPCDGARDLKDWQRCEKNHHKSDSSCSDDSEDSNDYAGPSRAECWDSDHSGCKRCCGESVHDDNDHIWEYETESDDEAAGSASKRCECV